MTPTTAHLALPFFDAVHRELGPRLAGWMGGQQVDESDDRAACREWVRRLGDAGWLRYCVPAGTDGALGGALARLDSRALVILRETLAFHSPLADFAFAMQGLGSGAITLAGTPEQQAAYLPQVASGAKIAAFALSEADAGSDAGAMTTRATQTASGWTANGSKTWISNGGPGGGHARHHRLHHQCRHARPRRQRAHRGDGAAPAGNAAIHRLPA